MSFSPLRDGVREWRPRAA